MGDDNNSFGLSKFLDGAFNECSLARLNKDVDKWFNVLCVITTRLSSDMSLEELTEFQGFEVSYLEDVNSCNVKNEEQGFNTIPISLVFKLSNWEIKLLKIYKVSGLQRSISFKKKKFT